LLYCTQSNYECGFKIGKYNFMYMYATYASPGSKITNLDSLSNQYYHQ